MFIFALSLSAPNAILGIGSGTPSVAGNSDTAWKGGSDGPDLFSWSLGAEILEPGVLG